MKKARGLGSPGGRYAPPSTYAHLSPLTDILEPGLICVFVGCNPGIQTATAGHAYAHPSNLFWKLLYSSGCTDRLLRPEQDVDLPRLYAMGNTNIVSRPTKDQSELSKQEMVNGTPTLEEKFRKYRPEAVCIVGKGIWEAIWKYKYGRAIKADEFHFGWQDEKSNMGRCGPGEHEWQGSRVFVLCSTSGLAASLRPPQKEEIWKPLGEWVKKRREERGKSAREGEKAVVGEGKKSGRVVRVLDGGRVVSLSSGKSSSANTSTGSVGTSSRGSEAGNDIGKTVEEQCGRISRDRE